MSYSRWINSIWYTFWSCRFKYQSTDEERLTRGAQTFEICDLEHPLQYTAQEIADDIDKCLQEVSDAFTPTQDELDELRVYMERFIQDVNDNDKLTGNKLVIK